MGIFQQLSAEPLSKIAPEIDKGVPDTAPVVLGWDNIFLRDPRESLSQRLKLRMAAWDVVGFQGDLSLSNTLLIGRPNATHIGKNPRLREVKRQDRSHS